MWKLLTDPVVFSTLLGGATWLANKVLGKKASTKAAKVSAAIATATAIGLQMTLTARPETTVESIIVQLKGLFAIQLAKAGIYEKDRAPYQLLIDKAISELVLRFIADHPDRKALTLPITAKVAGNTMDAASAAGGIKVVA